MKEDANEVLLEGAVRVQWWKHEKTLFRKKSIQKILDDSAAGYGDGEQHSLHKVLGVRDLTFFGIAAIIGAGIFSSIGKACFDGGPAVIFLYLFT